MVDNSRKKAREYLDDLKDEVRKPLTDWEDKEKERIKNHKKNYAQLESFIENPIDITEDKLLEYLKSRLSELATIAVNKTWDEFEFKAKEMHEKAQIFLKGSIEKQEKIETDRKELARIKKSEEERLQKERNEKIAKEAAEKTRLEAEEKAKLEKERTDHEKIEAEQRIKKAESDKLAVIEKAKHDKIKAEQDRVAAEKKAEQDKRDAAQLAEKSRLDAIDAERKRVEAEEKQVKEESIKRENNIKHRKTINNSILMALSKEVDISSDVGKKIITAIVQDKVPNLKIFY